MTKSEIIWVEGERFIGTGSSNHSITIDSDRESNTAPGPMEYVLLALCGCTATDVVSILNKKREPFTSLRVSAEADRAKEPPTVYTAVRLKYVVSGIQNRKAMEDAVRLSMEKYCSVSQMVKKTAEVTYVIEYA